MINTQTPSYPRKINLAARELEIRPFTGNDEKAMLDFARSLPAHDLLFMRRRITEPKVIAAWLREVEADNFPTLVATGGGSVVGCIALLRDPLSWSPHVAELRLVVAPALRSHGLGRALTEEAFGMALRAGIAKLMASMTVDQHAAIAMFEENGFKAEAVFREHVQDSQGRKHDIVILSLDLAKQMNRMQTYGVTDMT